jgi:hypothetical protein
MAKEKRKLGPPRGYRPAGDPVGYEPERSSRKAPSGYWCRYPYSDETLQKVQKARKKR